MLRTLCIAAIVAFAPAAHATTAGQMEANKKAVAEFYEFAVNKKDFEAAAKFLGTRYVQYSRWHYRASPVSARCEHGG
jgi:hypothetical protein